MLFLTLSVPTLQNDQSNNLKNLSAFDHFVGLGLKGLMTLIVYICTCPDVPKLNVNNICKLVSYNKKQLKISFLPIWSYLLKKSSIESVIF